jgi:hypothetical protein
MPRISAKAARSFRHLSPSIALKPNFLAVDLTVTSCSHSSMAWLNQGHDGECAQEQ